MSCTLLYTSGPNGLMCSTTEELGISDVPGKIRCGVTMFHQKEKKDHLEGARETDVHSGAAKTHCEENMIYNPAKTVIYPREIEVHPNTATIYASEDKRRKEAQHLQEKRGKKQQCDITWNCNSEGQKVDIPSCKKLSCVQDDLEGSQRSLTEEENSYSQTEKTSRNNSRNDQTSQQAVDKVYVPLYNCTPLEQTDRKLKRQKATVKVSAKLAQCKGKVECEKRCKITPVQALVVRQRKEKKVWVVLNNLLKVYFWAKCISQQLCMHRLSLKW